MKLENMFLQKKFIHHLEDENSKDSVVMNERVLDEKNDDNNENKNDGYT